MMNFTQGELDVIKGVLTAGVTSVLGFLSHNVWVRSKVVKAENLLSQVKNEINLHQTLAKEACVFAEQAYGQFGGARKLDVAKNWLISEVKSKLGVDLDSEVARGYIESALKNAKKEFGELWSEVPNTYPEKPTAPIETSSPTTTPK